MIDVELSKRGIVIGRADIAAGTDDPILDLIEQKRVAMPFGCRSGTCGTCQVRVLEGAQHLEGRGPVEEDSANNFGFPPEIRLACRTRIKEGATGPLKLELPEIL